MLAAHMDEIGVVASHVDERGFVRFQPVGGLRPLTLVGARVRFANGVRGVIGLEEKKVLGVPDLGQLYIDVGARAKDSVPVAVGDMACMDRDFADLGQRMVAKAFDDRIGCAILIQVLRELTETPHELHLAFTVQEELGLRGAQTAAYGIQAEWGVVVDITLTGDTPEARTMAIGLGGGPAIKVKDSGMVTHAGVRRALVDAAQRAGVPYQLEVLERGTTDGTAMQTSRVGMPVGVVSIPTRYAHTPSEMVDYQDVLHAVRLLVEVLRAPVAL